jgi:hypothetical protein
LAETEAYRNGSSLTGDNTERTRDASSFNMNLYLLARNYTTQGNWNGQMAIFFLGSQLSDEEVTSANTIIETYLDHLGTGVQ